MKLLKLSDAKKSFSSLSRFIDIINKNVFDTVSIDFESRDYTQTITITIYDEYGFELLVVHSSGNHECYLAILNNAFFASDKARMFITNDFGKVVEI